MPKRPLLDFDVAVDGRPAYLAKRAVVAEVEAEHVIALAEREGVQVDERSRQMILAICEFTPTVWRTFCGPPRRLRRTSRDRAMRQYLADGLKLLRDDQDEDFEWSRLDRAAIWIIDRIADKHPLLLMRRAWIDRPLRPPIELPEDLYQGWCEQARAAGYSLQLALHEGLDDASSADDPLLALPLLVSHGHVESVDEVAETLASFRSLVDALAVAAGGRPTESAALRALAVYGRRWQALIWCEVPLDRPFVIASSEELSIEIRSMGKMRIRSVPLADGVTNHLAVHVTDGNVEMPDVAVVGLDGTHLTKTFATGMRQTREGFAFYAAEPERDERVQVLVRLRVSRGIAAVGWVIQLIVWAAASMECYRLHAKTLTAADLAVLVVPTTFAASLLLTRDPNSLARRLQLRGRWLTSLATVSLWTLVALAYFTHRIVS